MKILVLSTWFPYPTNQGSKIRAHYLIRGLAEKHRVALLSMQDTAILPEWVAEMSKYCERVEVAASHPFAHDRIRSIAGFFSLEPRDVVSSYSREMLAATLRLAEEWQPDLVFALTFVTAPYALQIPAISRVVDMDNLLALMLYEEFQGADGPLSQARTYLAYQKFRRYESRLYRSFDLCLVCSAQDVRKAQTYIPLRDDQIGLAPNGVDLANLLPSPTEPQPGTMIFNGALTYHPNLDAMQYFTASILPEIVRQVPAARLTITGRTEGISLDELSGGNGHVQFTGYLSDIRPAVANSQVCVVPLRKGAGTRLKILEAMALGTPVVTTAKGAEGLDVSDGKNIFIADQPSEFAQKTVRLLQEPDLRRSVAREARRLVEKQYDWTGIGEHLSDIVDRVYRNSLKATA